jgi:hypothetical protein
VFYKLNFALEMYYVGQLWSTQLAHSDEVIGLKRRSRSTPQKHFLVLIFVGVKPRAIVRQEG